MVRNKHSRRVHTPDGLEVVSVDFGWKDVRYTIGNHQVLKGCTGYLGRGKFLGTQIYSFCIWQLWQVSWELQEVARLYDTNKQSTHPFCLVAFGCSGRKKQRRICFWQLLCQRYRLFLLWTRKHFLWLLVGQARSSSFPRNSGYVMQDDAFIETLTVYETLYYSLCLRLPSSYRTSEGISEEIIENILETLNIKKVRDVQIGDPLKRFVMWFSPLLIFCQRHFWWWKEKTEHRRWNGYFAFRLVYRWADVWLGLTQCFKSDESHSKFDGKRYDAGNGFLLTS